MSCFTSEETEWKVCTSSFRVVGIPTSSTPTVPLHPTSFIYTQPRTARVLRAHRPLWLPCPGAIYLKTSPCSARSKPTKSISKNRVLSKSIANWKFCFGLPPITFSSIYFALWITESSYEVLGVESQSSNNMWKSGEKGGSQKLKACYFF